MALTIAPDVLASSPRAKPAFDFATFLEVRAAPLAYCITLISVILRGAAFYSGGALVLSHLLGQTGLAWFDAISGFGIAAGAEIVSSVAGRAWRRSTREAFESSGRAGIKRSEREALVAYHLSQALVSKRFMWVAFGGTVIATFGFFWQANPDHSIAAMIYEFVIAALLVVAVSFLGIFHDPHKSDPREVAEQHAAGIRFQITEVSGQRIAAGVYSAADVAQFAEQLPTTEREGFRRALMPYSPDDPAWGTAEVVDWLGISDLPALDQQSQRRQVNRKLAALARSGAPITKSDRGHWQIPRSKVFEYFADDFTRMRSPIRALQRVVAVAPPETLHTIDDTSLTAEGHSGSSGGDSAPAADDVALTPVGARHSD